MTRILALLLTGGAVACCQDLVRIPPAAFEAVDEVTGIKVRVTTGAFLMAAGETTQREYAAVTGTNPSHQRGDDLPVENVSWWDAIRYCNLRSVKEGLQPCYDLASGACDRTKNGYRLPTEAEWRAAAGASGTQPAANLGGRDTKNTALLLDSLRKGATKRGTYPPNRLGLFDMFGNVWEWCNDFYDALNTFSTTHDPQGRAHGLERVIRGGSFATSGGGWSKGYRSSMDPASRSRFTGFRVCRSEPAQARAGNVSAPRYDPPKGFETAGGLSPLPAPGTREPAQWRAQAARLREKWMQLLGAPAVPPPAPAIRVVETFREPSYTGTLAYLQVEPDAWEKIYILQPPGAAGRPLPVVIVPFYDVDTPAGADLGGRRFVPMGVRAFAHLAAQRGFMAVAVRWFGESYGESYSEAVANLKLKHPACTGMGKWVWDARRVLDYLHTRPDVDRGRIGIIGHSLGGKMALYAAALDERIGVVVSSEPGIGFSFSNYEDFWYFGEKLATAAPGTDQHELLGLTAPRPFLLIAGDSADSDKSWHYINAARQVYALFGQPDRITCLNHRKGHSPTPEAVAGAMDWLEHFLRQ